MRMGGSQGFEVFLDDFELKLANCGELNWPDEDKIIRIDEAINTKLSNVLIDVDLPDNDYDRWVSRVRKTASRSEARPVYITDSITATIYLDRLATTTFFPTVVNNQSETSQVKLPPKLDADGDVQISGVNLVSLINALVGRANSGTSSSQNSNKKRQGEAINSGAKKTRAKRLARTEANELIAEGRCLRCRKKGHLRKNGPTFGPAIRPAVNHASTRHKEDMSDGYDSAPESLSGKD
ncbi:hypothetical protein K3495_g8369 [Podosphaera aphanis]|nr:hypothetical protein K3495_g8369 [Podosphaera aphanis]